MVYRCYRCYIYGFHGIITQISSLQQPPGTRRQVLDIDDDAEFLTQPVSESRAQEIMKAVMTVGSEGYHKVASETL